MKNHVKINEESYEEINRILSHLVEQLNQTLKTSLAITPSPEWVQNLHEEYIRVAPELDIHNCSKFLILRINEYVLGEAEKQLKDRQAKSLIDTELSDTQWQIKTLLKLANLNGR